MFFFFFLQRPILRGTFTLYNNLQQWKHDRKDNFSHVFIVASLNKKGTSYC